MLLVPLIGFSQTLTKKISEIKLYGLHSVEYKFDLDLDKNDTTSTRIYISFLNKEYGRTVENNVSLYKKKDANGFIKDLKRSLEFIGKNQIIYFNSGEGYKLEFKEDYSKTLFINNSDGKSKNIYKKEIIKLIKWLESLDLNYLED